MNLYGALQVPALKTKINLPMVVAVGNLDVNAIIFTIGSFGLYPVLQFILFWPSMETTP